MASDFPGKVPPTPSSESTKRIEMQGEGKQPAQSFETFMQRPENEPGAGKTAEPSPFDLPQGRGQGTQAPPTVDSVLEQMNTTQDHLSTIKEQLNDKNLKLKQSQKYLINNKLQDANGNIRSAASKTGVDVPSLKRSTSRQSPVGKFLGIIQDSQDQVDSAAQTLRDAKNKGSSMTPADLLMVQVKLSRANTELEYTSVLMSTISSDVKTVFNIQI